MTNHNVCKARTNTAAPTNQQQLRTSSMSTSRQKKLKSTFGRHKSDEFEVIGSRESKGSIQVLLKWKASGIMDANKEVADIKAFIKGNLILPSSEVDDAEWNDIKWAIKKPSTKTKVIFDEKKKTVPVATFMDTNLWLYGYRKRNNDKAVKHCFVTIGYCVIGDAESRNDSKKSSKVRGLSVLVPGQVLVVCDKEEEDDDDADDEQKNGENDKKKKHIERRAHYDRNDYLEVMLCIFMLFMCCVFEIFFLFYASE